MVIISRSGHQVSAVVSCNATDSVEDIVAIAPGSTTPYAVHKVDVYSNSVTPGVGIITQKLTATQAVVHFSDRVQLSTLLSPGKTYFIGSGSKPSPAPPAKGPNQTLVQPVGIALNQDTLLLQLDRTITVQHHP